MMDDDNHLYSLTSAEKTLVCAGKRSNERVSACLVEALAKAMHNLFSWAKIVLYLRISSINNWVELFQCKGRWALEAMQLAQHT